MGRDTTGGGIERCGSGGEDSGLEPMPVVGI